MLTIRPRRNRRSDSIRRMIEENILKPADLVAPFFILEGSNKRESVPSFPGVDRISVDHLLKEAEFLHAKGIPSVALFPVIDPSQKDPTGSFAHNPSSHLYNAIRTLKKEIPSLCVIVDVALDPYTSHSFDGIIDENGKILNDPTVKILSQISLHIAEAGADMVAPSDMMDGRIGSIRMTLDEAGYQEIGIIAYTAKYASSLYAPFRDTLRSKLKFGDKKSYFLNPANCREAVRQAHLDVEQGADMIIIKPALYYLDVIKELRSHVNVPIAAYHVSGEHAMVMAAHANGWLDAPSVFYEGLLSLKRSGADFIFTYSIPQILPLITK